MPRSISVPLAVMLAAVGMAGCRKSQTPAAAPTPAGPSGEVKTANLPAQAAQSGIAIKPGAEATPASPPSNSSPADDTGMDAGAPRGGSGVLCLDYKSYFIVSKELVNQVGSDVLVKYKDPGQEAPPCAYVSGKGDLEIKNEFAESFMGLHGELLFLDSSTGPGQSGLTIWNLTSRKKAFETAYLGPYHIDGTSMTLWQVAREDATDKQCPEAGKIRSEGLTATIEEETVLNLATFSLTPTGKTRCGTEQ